MSKLVDELVADHKVMAEIMNKVKTLGIGSQEGQKLLLSAKTRLLDHLKKEDRELYPVLNAAAENDAYLKSTLDIFAKDMDEITNNWMAFFKKYAAGGSGIEFGKEFGKLSGQYSQRVGKEERVLYTKYNELKS